MEFSNYPRFYIDGDGSNANLPPDNKNIGDLVILRSEGVRNKIGAQNREYGFLNDYRRPDIPTVMEIVAKGSKTHLCVWMDKQGNYHEGWIGSCLLQNLQRWVAHSSMGV